MLNKVKSWIVDRVSQHSCTSAMVDKKLERFNHARGNFNKNKSEANHARLVESEIALDRAIQAHRSLNLRV